MQRLRLDLQLVERVLQKDAAGRDSEHRKHRVGIGDDLCGARRDQVFAQPGVVAAQQRDHALAAGLSGEHQAMDFVRSREAGAEARDLDNDRANLFVDGRRLERIAQMIEASRAAPHDLIERRTRHVLFNRTRQANYQNGVMRNLRWSDDGEMKRRHQRQPDSEGGYPDLPVSGR